MPDTYKTISQPAEGVITEKKSKFISHIFPIKTADEAQELLAVYRKKYDDAGHVCWAYMIGWGRGTFRWSDDGEPSGTAGRPILGQINSYELTDVLLLVVRYFGGTLLGTGGLIKAYKEAAAEAITNVEIIEKTIDDVIEIQFDYVLLNEVMRVLKQFDEVRWEQNFTANCVIRLQIRRSLSEKLSRMLKGVYGVEVRENL